MKFEMYILKKNRQNKDFLKSKLFVWLWLLCATPTFGWLLGQLGLNETYRVRHLSTHFTRVFLSINVKSETFPTLIESQWPVRYAPLRASVFPNIAAHEINPKNRNCRRLQRSIWTQVDNLNRLWVMDIGGSWQSKNNKKLICPPKLLVYDLLRNNVEILRIDCSRFLKTDPSKLLAIKLGPPPTRRCQDVEKYIYFLRADNSHILAYDIIEQRWQQRLLVSRKYENVTPEILPIKPIDFAFGIGQKRELLISDIDGGLYRTRNIFLQLKSENLIQKSTSLEEISNGSNTRSGDLLGNLELEYLGSLLGPSRGMMIDYMDVLYYVVPKFGAVVRCPHYRKNLTAEGNEIIYMTSKNIQQIFFGTSDSVWLVTDRILQPNDHCFAGLA